MAEKEIRLKVAEAIQDDVNKGIVRIDSNFMKQIDLRVGNIVELEGERKTVGIVDRAYPGDIGLNIIRMDGLTRRNARTGLGEMVIIRKADVKEAKKVVIAPAKKEMTVKIFQPDVLKQSILGRAVVKGDLLSLGGTGRRRTAMRQSHSFEDIFDIFEEEIMGLGALAEMKFVVVDTLPKMAVVITDQTDVVFNPEGVEVLEEKSLEVTYEDIGGLESEIKKIREMVELPLKHPEIFEKLGIEAPKGVLLHGPPGTGKTLLAKAVANETNSNFILINGPELMSKYYGQSEANIRKKFEDAEKGAPSIIFIDEIDAIAPKREEVHGEVERRVVAQILANMDGLKSRGKVVVIAATNIPNMIDPALRRPGRFDREIEIGVPSKEGRLDILKIHTRNMPLDKDVNLKEIADITYGFVGADLSALAKEAAMIVLRRILPDLRLQEEQPIPKDILEKLKVRKSDFKEALKVVRPSAMREVLVEIPNVKWSDIGGLDDVKQELKEAVEWPLKHPDSFKRLGVKPPKGILLFGAPGTGKTMLAKAVATESQANFISVKGPELLCVASDTKILSSHCGATEISTFYENIHPISELVEKKEDYEVRNLKEPVYTYAIGKDGSLKKTAIKTVHKLWVKGAYKIFFNNNAEITCSANQPFLTFRNNSLEWVTAKDITENDYIAYPAYLKPFDRIVPLKLLDNKNLRMVKEDEDSYHVKVFSTKEITRLPKNLTKELAAFLGWFVSEGNISKEAITICNHNKKNQEEIFNLFRQFVEKDRIKVYKDRVVVYSTPLVNYLENIFNQKLARKKSHIIKCPSILAKCTKEVISSFLMAAYKGDGCITNTKIEYYSKSKELTEGISYLLAICGIKAKYWKRKDDIFIATISGKKEMETFRKVVMKEKVSGMLRNEYNAQYLLPPVSGLLKKIKKESNLVYDKHIPDGSFEYAISGRRKLGLIRFQRIMEIYEKEVKPEIKMASEFQVLKKIAKGDFLWTKIKNKTKAEPQIMFDVETEDDSFIGGNIPFLLHNSKWVGESEKAVREVFKKARQTSPTIIFFDEIDSIAPRRGASSDSHVSERVVNQLLTEMEGLVDLNDIVIIAATNRPDILDTALLRPGRFDRIILTIAPDIGAREEIFKAHTKKMPLKNVDLKKLAEETEGYTGADIESLCREAAILALRESMDAKQITAKHFENAMKKVKPSITNEIEKAYEGLLDFFRSARAKQMEEEKPSYMG